MKYLKQAEIQRNQTPKALAKPGQHLSQQILTLLDNFRAFLDIVGGGGGQTSTTLVPNT